MVRVQQAFVGKRPSGGLVFLPRDKKLYEAGRQPTETRIGAVKKVTHRLKGGGAKVRLVTCNVANVYDPKKKVFAKASVDIVASNAANRNYVRRNVMTKGTVINTSLGKARVTNRPGQEGQINAVLVE